MFQDEAGFGRIAKPRACWTPLKKRPQVASHHIREYRYAFGAVSPQNGEHFFFILPYSKTDCMTLFLQELSKAFPEKRILLICDNAPWHKSNGLEVPDNIRILHILPYTPEMNPIEQVWAEIRKCGFANRIFSTLDQVMDQLCSTINTLTSKRIKSITHREWILNAFLEPN